MKTHFLLTCPKCSKTSGDDWSQCKGSCPIPLSPVFKPEEGAKHIPKKAKPE